MDKINSVIYLRVVKAIYRADRPYLNPNDGEISGTGFIIDIGKGLVVTNAHVVSNAISIIGRNYRSGKKDLSLELIGICREKDLAICKINSNDISLITQGLNPMTDLNLKIGDSLQVKPGDKVITIGYTLNSENVKITTGVVSGFETLGNALDHEGNGKEDNHSREPSYIQIDTVVDMGNSGGPLLNVNGKVIGINVGRMGYAIPSSTFLAIYNHLMSSIVVRMPTLGVEWCKTNREIMKKQTGSSSTYGIYIRKVYPDSCFDLLEKGDIVRRIDYIDTFRNSNGE